MIRGGDLMNLVLF